MTHVPARVEKNIRSVAGRIKTICLNILQYDTKIRILKVIVNANT